MPFATHSERDTEVQLDDYITQKPDDLSQGRAIPHTLILKMHDVSTHQKARPGPLDQAARTGSQTIVVPG